MDPRERANDFWTFFALRQEAYWRKEDGGPGPYSPDPVIARYHFCNVYREADRGTKWFQRHRHDALASSIVYRPVNKIATFEAYGHVIPTLDTAPRFVEWIDAQVAAGKKPFTGRHQTRGVSRYRETIEYARERFDDIAYQVLNATTREEVCGTLSAIPNIGPFFSWQILCDLLEAIDPKLYVTDAVRFDDWALLGPGARRGAFLIDPIRNPLDTAKWLRDTQPADLPAPPPEAPGPVSLKNVEHALCEFVRYENARAGRPGLEVKPWA